MRNLFLFTLSLLPLFCVAQSAKELARFSAPNATQAVAVDSLYFYTVSNSKIVKHRKDNGTVVMEQKYPFKHLNSGIIIDGKLYCSNSNYPEVPMASSLEIFDPNTLEHIGSHSFGIYIGSFTWIDRWQGDWYLMFVHYENYAQEAGKGVAYTMLIQTDSLFRQKAGWVLPKPLIERIRPESISGGSFSADGKLFLNPHHFEEMYICQIPTMGYELELLHTISVPFQGQGLAWDRYQPNVLWGMRRDTREVISMKIED